VVDEAAVGQPLDRGGHGARAQAQPLRERAGVGTTVTRQAVDGFERLAIWF
jgi:hypothetical protein